MAAAAAPGKLILFGEHAAVHGETVVATSVGLLTTTKVIATDDSMMSIHLPSLDLDLAFPMADILACQEQLGPFVEPGSVRIYEASHTDALQQFSSNKGVLAGLFLFLSTMPETHRKELADNAGFDIRVTSTLPTGNVLNRI